MTLSREYQDKFDALKQRFNCSNEELEALLRETYKSGKGYSATLENLIDYQIGQLDVPRRRIYAIGNPHPERRRRGIKEPPKERLSAREIRELFGAYSPLDAKFSRGTKAKLAKFRQRLNRKRINNLRKLKQRRQDNSATRVNRLLDFLKREGKREISREAYRIGRKAVRHQVRRVFPLIQHF